MFQIELTRHEYMGKILSAQLDMLERDADFRQATNIHILREPVTMWSQLASFYNNPSSKEHAYKVQKQIFETYIRPLSFAVTDCEDSITLAKGLKGGIYYSERSNLSFVVFMMNLYETNRLSADQVTLLMASMDKIKIREPDFVIYFKLDANLSWEKIFRRNRIAEVASIKKSYVQQIADAHDACFLGQTNTFVVDASKSIQEVQTRMKEILLSIIKCRIVNIKLR